MKKCCKSISRRLRWGVIGKESKIYVMKGNDEKRILQSLCWKSLLGFLLPVVSALILQIFFIPLLQLFWVFGVTLLAVFPFFCLFLGIGLTSVGWLLHKLRSRNFDLFAFGIGLSIGGLAGIYILIFNLIPSQY